MTYDYQAPPESYFATTMQENDDLNRCVDESPHVVTFWNAVCAFINHEREHGENPDRVLECPSWGQWRSIVQHHVAGKKVEAVKLLRASTYAWTGIPPSPPFHIANEKWRAFMAANALPAWDRRGGLTLSEAKSILDTLEVTPHWFGRDTNRVFNPLHVTCAEALDGGHVPQEPKSLGDLLRGRISTMCEKAAEEEPERSLWLNIYPEPPGHDSVGASGTRAKADQFALNDRIACINVKYKKGEGL